MFYWLYQTFADHVSAFNLFKYLTFRSGAAVFTSLILSLTLGGRAISFLRMKQHGGQPIREDGPKTHLETKKGTPTMGGVLILFSWTVSCLLWMAWDNAYVWIALLFTLGCGGLGFADDYLKVVKRNPRGVSGKTKLVVQFSLAAAATAAIAAATPHPLATQLSIPLFKDFLPDLGLLFFPFAMVVMTGASNAVNLTDGLDGLATMPAVIAAGCFALIAYLTGNAIYSGYLGILHVPNAGELAVFCSAMIGAGLGFLWYNAPPARVFMGDVGSLALGGALGVVSVITKHEIVLAIVGGLFVMEAISVILQVYYFKLTKGKRLFRMAPLHHHFELRGWPETAVVVRFWIVSAIFALLGLATLKIR